MGKFHLALAWLKSLSALLKKKKKDILLKQIPHLPSYHHLEMCVMLSKEEHVTSCPYSLKQGGLRAATVMLAALRWPEEEDGGMGTPTCADVQLCKGPC